MPGRRVRGGKSLIDGSLESPFIIYNPHQKQGPLFDGENITIVSIDPGIKNCGMYIEKINTKTDEKKSILLTRMQFDQSENYYTDSIKQFEKLEKKANLFSQAHYIIIEKQMAISYQNTRMGQHLITFFTTITRDKGNLPVVMEFSPKAKTKVLDCPPGMKKPEYKKWCYHKAVDLLKKRDSPDEQKFIDCIEIAKKKDDMGDTICQAESWWRIIKSGLFSYPEPVCFKSSLE